MEIQLLKWLTAKLRNQLAELRRAPTDAGNVTEYVVVTAILIALAIAVGAILTAKLKNKVNTLDLG